MHLRSGFARNGTWSIRREKRRGNRPCQQEQSARRRVERARRNHHGDSEFQRESQRDAARRNEGKIRYYFPYDKTAQQQRSRENAHKLFGGRRCNMYDAKRSSGTQCVRNNRRRQDVRLCNRLGRANDRSRRQRTHVGTRRFGFRARRTQ